MKVSSLPCLGVRKKYLAKGEPNAKPFFPAMIRQVCFQVMGAWSPSLLWKLGQTSPVFNDFHRGIDGKTPLSIQNDSQNDSERMILMMSIRMSINKNTSHYTRIRRVTIMMCFSDSSLVFVPPTLTPGTSFSQATSHFLWHGGLCLGLLGRGKTVNVALYLNIAKRF